MGLVEDREVLRLQCSRYRGYRGGVFRADVAPAARAVTVVSAAGATFVHFGIDCGRRRVGLPPQFLRRFHHQIAEPGAAQRRHGIFTTPRRFKHVAARIDGPADISSLTRNTQFVFHRVVVRLQVLIGQRPVFQGGALRNCADAIPFHGFSSGTEVPLLQAPALRPVVDGGSADGVHHGMNAPAGPRLLPVVLAHGRNFLVGLGYRCQQAAHVVVQFIRPELVRVHPGARFNAGDFQSSLSQRKYGNATRRSQTDDGNVNRFQINGHIVLRRLSAGLLWAYRASDRRAQPPFGVRDSEADPNRQIHCCRHSRGH